MNVRTIPLMLLILELLIFSRQVQSLPSESPCNQIHDCFNCTMFSRLDVNCKWNLYKCEQVNRAESYKNWWQYFSVCTLDTSGYNTMRNYCGGILEKNPPFTASLVLMKGGTYGTKNIYCRWNAINEDVTRYISINFTKLHAALNDEYAMEVIYADGRSTLYSLQSPDFFISLQLVENIYFHYFTAEAKSELPFFVNFEIKDDDSDNYIGLFISLAVIVFLCVVCSILFYKCSRMIIENTNRRMMERLRAANLENQDNSNNTDGDQNDPQRREERIKRNNWQTLSALFEKELQPRKYDPNINEFGANCTICLDDFKNDNQVTKLINCKHLFHSKCLKSWCEKILLHPKCPNCNEMIIPGMKDDDIPEVEVMHINRASANTNTNRNVNSNRILVSRESNDNSHDSHSHALSVVRNNSNETRELNVHSIHNVSGNLSVHESNRVNTNANLIEMHLRLSDRNRSSNNNDLDEDNPIRLVRRPEINDLAVVDIANIDINGNNNENEPINQESQRETKNRRMFARNNANNANNNSNSNGANVNREEDMVRNNFI